MLYLVLYLVSSYCFKKYPLLNTKYRGIYENKEPLERSVSILTFFSRIWLDMLEKRSSQDRFPIPVVPPTAYDAVRSTNYDQTNKIDDVC